MELYGDLTPVVLAAYPPTEDLNKKTYRQRAEAAVANFFF